MSVAAPPPAGPALPTREHALHLLGAMLRIRQFEDRCAQLYTEQKIRGFLHLYNGQEAVAVGIMQCLDPKDAIVATYREHGHALARGLPMGPLMAEMYGKRTGCSGGRGGSMHVFDVSRRFYGGNAIVGGALPLAVGLALAEQAAGARRHRRLLLRRGRGGRGRIPRVAEPGGAVEAAGAVRLREQPVRDGHGAGALGGGDRHLRQGRRLRHGGAAGRRHGRAGGGGRGARGGRGDPRRRRADACSSAAPTGCVRTRCSTRSSIATRPRSRSGASAGR